MKKCYLYKSMKLKLFYYLLVTCNQRWPFGPSLCFRVKYIGQVWIWSFTSNSSNHHNTCSIETHRTVPLKGIWCNNGWGFPAWCCQILNCFQICSRWRSPANDKQVLIRERRLWVRWISSCWCKWWGWDPCSCPIGPADLVNSVLEYSPANKWLLIEV